MRQYLNLLKNIRDNGEDRSDRTGTGTISLFAPPPLTFDLQQGFPLLTTKRIHTKSVIGELLWILKGYTNISWLNDRGITIWDEWADDKGDLGPVYGKQMRDFNGTDQLLQVVDQIVRMPHSRRHIITLWNPAEVNQMALPPCHGLVIQFYVRGEYLDCQMYQRSADVFLGVPFNIASYAMLTHIVAAATGYKPGRLTLVLGDAHLYQNHINQAEEQLRRTPKSLPEFRVLANIGVVGKDIHLGTFKEYIKRLDLGSFLLVDYDPWPAIKAPVAV